MIETIYLDMDGVISDFDKRYSAIYGCNCRDDPNEKHWFEFVKQKGFFLLDPCKGMVDLIEKLFSLDVNVVILTCVSERKNHGAVRDQKIDWLKEYNLGHLPAIFTRTKLQKSNFASPTSLIIDDSVKCVEPFKQKGGYGILHQNVKQTIIELNCLKDKGLLCALSLDPVTQTY